MGPAAAKNHYHLKTAPSTVRTGLEELGQKLPWVSPTLLPGAFLYQGWIKSNEGHQKPRSH